MREGVAESGKKRQWVESSSLASNFEVQMWATCVSRGAGMRDELAAADMLTHLDDEGARVGVPTRVAPAVGDDDKLAETALHAGEGHLSRARGADRSPPGCADVDAEMPPVRAPRTETRDDLPF